MGFGFYKLLFNKRSMSGTLGQTVPGILARRLESHCASGTDVEAQMSSANSMVLDPWLLRHAGFHLNWDILWETHQIEVSRDDLFFYHSY